MKIFFKKIIPNSVLRIISVTRQLGEWRSREYTDNAPQFVKENVFLKYGVPKAKWVETGTYFGSTTDFLVKNFGTVYSIEPSKELFENAVKKFKNENVELFNDVSEAIFPQLLPTLNGDINFWLDGHYSGGVTFKGKTDCPVEDELTAIKDNLSNFDKVSILVDDVRCFLPTNEDFTDYPSIDYLVDWARANKLTWRIEQDIFVMRNFS